MTMVRRLVAVVFVGGIAGMVVTNIAGSFAGPLTFGLITTAAALCLIAATTVEVSAVAPRFDDTAAAQLESDISAAVTAGAPEDLVRTMVRHAVSMGADAARNPGPSN